MDDLPLPTFPGPHLAGPAHLYAPFSLAGRVAWLGGTEELGIQQLRVQGVEVLRRLRVRDSGPAYSARATPIGFERRLHVEGREVLERCVVPPHLPGAIVEWTLQPANSSSGPCLDPVDLDLEWLSAIGGAAAPSGGDGRQLLLSGTGLHAAFVFSRAASPVAEAATVASHTGAHKPARAEPADLLCRAGVRLAPGERLRMTVVAAPSSGALEETLQRLRDGSTLIAAAAADYERRAGESLVLGAPAPGAGLAMRWAVARLHRFLVASAGGGALASGGGSAHALAVVAGLTGAGPAGESAEAALRVGLALLTAGDPGAAIAVARHQLDASMGTEACDSADVSAIAALVLYSQHLLATGDAGPARAEWARLLRAGERLAAASAPVELAAAALALLALAAESAGQQADAASLRAGARRLAGEDAAARALAQAGGWAEWAGGETEGAYRSWSARAESGFTGGRALWPGASGPDDALATAAVVTGVTRGMLGLEPDAPRGRLLLRPQFPAAWEHAEIGGIRVGDAEVLLRFRREPAHIRFELQQVAGAVPLRVALETAIPGEVTGARVDGTAAALAPRRWGERTLVAVQLVLDARRALELEVRESKPGETRTGKTEADPLRRGPAGDNRRT